MKHDGRCPKCGGDHVVRIPGAVGGYGAGNNVPMGWFVFSAIKVSRYACTDCGFLEEWVDVPGDLKRLRERFDRVEPRSGD